MVHIYTLGTISIVGLTGCVWMYLKAKIKNNEPLRETIIYKEAMAAMRNHIGAIKYLGLPIEDKKLYVTNIEDVSDEIRKTEVHVEVKGSSSFGLLYFWVTQYIKNPENAYLDEVQLQIGGDTSRRLVIKESGNQNDTSESQKVENKIENKKENNIDNKIESNKENKIENRTENKIENRTENKIENKVEEKKGAESK